MSRPNSQNVIAHRLRELRKKANLSQDELTVKCQLAGWDLYRASISKIETGTRNVSDYEVVMFARVLGCQVEDLLPTDANIRRFLAR